MPAMSKANGFSRTHCGLRSLSRRSPLPPLSEKRNTEAAQQHGIGVIARKSLTLDCSLSGDLEDKM